MRKIDGLNYLLLNGFPTIQVLSIVDLENNVSLLNDGISVRLSSKTENDKVDVYLKSIHNIHDLCKIKDFISNNQNDYDVIIHKTVKPELIGAVSKYSNLYNDVIVMEIYKNFDERSHGIVGYRAIVEMIDGQIISISNDDFVSKRLFRQIMNYISGVEYNDYTVEFVVEQGKLFFTDFYTKELKNKKYLKKYK